MNKVQALPGYYEIHILPVEEGDKELFFNGAAGFYDLTGEQHGSFFESAEALMEYIEKVEEAGFDDHIIDSFDLLPLRDYERGMDEGEINEARGISPEAQAIALSIKKNLLSRG